MHKASRLISFANITFYSNKQGWILPCQFSPEGNEKWEYWGTKQGVISTVSLFKEWNELLVLIWWQSVTSNTGNPPFMFAFIVLYLNGFTDSMKWWVGGCFSGATLLSHAVSSPHLYQETMDQNSWYKCINTSPWRFETTAQMKKPMKIRAIVPLFWMSPFTCVHLWLLFQFGMSFHLFCLWIIIWQIKQTNRQNSGFASLPILYVLYAILYIISVKSTQLLCSLTS